MSESEAIAKFILRQSVVYQRHSSDAIWEDMVLAVREFGVAPEAFYDPEDVDAIAALRVTRDR